MSFRFAVPCILVVSAAASCAATATPEELASAEIGPAPSIEDCKLAAKVHVLPRLKDPGSAQFGWGKSVEKRAYRTFLGSKKIAWTFQFSFNAKNSFGGYVGARPAALYCIDSTFVAASEGEPGGVSVTLNLDKPMTISDVRTRAADMGIAVTAH